MFFSDTDNVLDRLRFVTHTNNRTIGIRRIVHTAGMQRRSEHEIYHSQCSADCGN